jgi:lysine 2,3-aminomutase
LVFQFNPVTPADTFKGADWTQWTWQLRHRLTSAAEFSKVFELSESEKQGFESLKQVFKVAATPYYASLAASLEKEVPGYINPIRRILMPTGLEAKPGEQQMLDPLAEDEHSATSRLVHRFSDRVLFLLTDTCSVYCRFCTRKRFTGSDEGLIHQKEYEQSIEYIRRHPGIREVIFSGGDPLTVSNNVLKRVLSDIRAIPHVEIIRIGTRMPVVCPMRIDEELCQILKSASPVYLMNHFSHPKELTLEATKALTMLADHGIPLFNQMVLLNGVNNAASVIQALCRRLLFLRVKPYYLFQCDPSEGTDHLRTTVESSEALIREMWGHLSGLAMPTLSLDIPAGGGKATLVPQFQVAQSEGVREFVGWDGRRGVYINPKVPMLQPGDAGDYLEEWERLKGAKKIEEVRTQTSPSRKSGDLATSCKSADPSIA